MSNPERFLGYLTAGVRSFDKMPRANDALAADDIAHGCAGMPDDAYWMVTAKWADHAASKDHLFKRLLQRAQRLAKRERWRIPNGRDYVRNMVLLAIYEACASQRCDDCNGTGYVNEHDQCPECKATGKQKLTGKDRARLVGVAYSNWKGKACWQKRYESVYRIVSAWENIGLGHLAKRLR